MKGPSAAASRKRQAGYALFFVLSLILLLSLLLTGLARDSRQQANSAVRTLQAAEARTEAEAALSLSIMRLLAVRPKDRWAADGAERAVKIGGTEWRVAITPEDGKVDINHAPPPLLTELFTAAGLPAEEAQALADRVIDWRDADELRRLNGAERRAYEDAGLRPPRNGPFLAVQELRQVMGMTEDLYSCIADAITVYTGKTGIDRRFASKLTNPNAHQDGQTPSKLRSPLTSETLVGKAITVRLTTRHERHRSNVFEWVLRITERSASPYWIQASRWGRNERKPVSSSCVSHRSRPQPGEEISTQKG